MGHFIKQYEDEEKLELIERVWVTKDVKRLLKKAHAEYRKQNRRISLSKMVCNLVIEKYGEPARSDRGQIRPRIGPKTKEAAPDQDTR